MTETNQEIKYPFTTAESNIAESEGWGIFDIDANGTDFQIQMSDEAEIFKTDKEAWEFVIAKAVNGSELHRKAIAFIKATSINEFNGYVKDVDVIEVASLDDERAANHKQPWLLQFANGEGVGFKSEDDACAGQRNYRKSLSLDPMTGE